MAIYRVKPAGGFSSTVHAETAELAIAQFIAKCATPIYCKCHAEIADRHTAHVGQMGHFTPHAPHGPFTAIQMREVYMGGGWCLMPVAEMEAA